jgi:hypothetical protein
MLLFLNWMPPEGHWCHSHLVEVNRYVRYTATENQKGFAYQKKAKPKPQTLHQHAKQTLILRIHRQRLNWGQRVPFNCPADTTIATVCLADEFSTA